MTELNFDSSGRLTFDNFALLEWRRSKVLRDGRSFSLTAHLDELVSETISLVSLGVSNKLSISFSFRCFFFFFSSSLSSLLSAGSRPFDARISRLLFLLWVEDLVAVTFFEGDLEDDESF